MAEMKVGRGLDDVSNSNEDNARQKQMQTAMQTSEYNTWCVFARESRIVLNE